MVSRFYGSSQAQEQEIPPVQYPPLPPTIFPGQCPPYDSLLLDPPNYIYIFKLFKKFENAFIIIECDLSYQGIVWGGGQLSRRVLPWGNCPRGAYHFHTIPFDILRAFRYTLQISDSFGRKKVLFTVVAILGIAGFISGIAPNWQTYACMRFLLGVSEPNI